MAIACAFVAAVVIAFFAGSAWGADVPNDVGSGVPPSGNRVPRSPGPAFSPELLSAESAAVGNLVQRANEELWNTTALYNAVAERNKIAEVGASVRSGDDSQAGSGDTSPRPSGSGDFLECTKAIESGGDYGAVSPGGTYRGAYQFDQQTWQSVGGTGDPAAASPAEQDARAAQLYAERGSQPWGGRCG